MLNPVTTPDHRRPSATQPPVTTDDLLAAGVIKKGDEVFFRLKPSDVAHVVDSTFLSFQGKHIRYNEWGRQMSRWSAINIYEWFVLKRLNQTLDQVRSEWAAQQQQVVTSTDGNGDAIQPVQVAIVAPNGESSSTNDNAIPIRSKGDPAAT